MTVESAVFFMYPIVLVLLLYHVGLRVDMIE